MSIKNLFSQNRTESREYSDYIDDKTTFEPVESSRNAKQIRIEQNTFVPQIDYSKPNKFVRFGSAEMYYSGAMTHIMDYYPYDGSMAEINKFYNSMMPVEKYIFDNLYPRFNGHAIFSADGWGSGTLTSDGYGVPDTKEYILFKGGPHGVSGPLSSITNNPYNNKYQNSNIYDEDLYTNAGLPSDYDVGTRESNLKTNFDTGVTVEFWLKKDAFVTSTSEKEVVFDLWNSGSSGSVGYGRLTVALTGAASGSPFIITAQSGTVSASISNSSIGDNLTTSSLGTWGHYALRFYNTGSDFIAKLYVNGQLNDTNTYSSQKLGEITSGSMLASLGALVGPPSGSSAARGSGKLSGSMDDFRFWKTSRNSDQISTNYFDRIGGGTNTDISNTTLGVYYKFNEGITQDSSIDSVVLDYSGRISNGVWVGYGSNSRNTGSAIVLAGAATKEYKDPVIRSTHPDYVTLKSNLITSGTNHDVNNAATFINYAPSWILDQHDDTENRNLKIISHIMGAYFDKMYMLASQIPNFKQINYTTASHSPIPFASHLPTSLGMYVPDLFVDATILENLSDRTKTEHFESKLHDTKNLIYLNLYNNLTNIYKSKGTEKSIRNVLRCFNLDDELISVKIYNKNSKYKIRDNLKQIFVEKTAVNFDTADNNGAVVYQRKNSSNAQSVGFISGSQDTGTNGPEEFNGATVEVDFIFPKYLARQQTFDRDYVTGSVFGLHAVSTGSSATMDGTDTTLMATDVANFQVLALREKEDSKNVYFKLTSSYAPYPLPELTSSVFLNAYDDTRWNVSVRIKPKDYPIAGMVSSSLSNTYDVIFRGVNSVLGVVKNSFEVSGTITNASGSALLRAPKRLYVGAMRTNLTGALLHKSDVEVLNARYWTKFVNTASLDLHAFGKENSGIYDSYQNLAPIDSVGATGDLTNRQTLALNWNFDNVTSSDSGGNFTVQDYSSGSAEARENYGWLGKITGYQHSGYGNNFAASSTSVIEKRKINSYTFVDPEQTVGSDMISILTEDDKVFGVDKINPSYVYSVEKNMYDAISAEMINFFAGAIDFNQLVGAPANRYRHQYKEIEKLRESFFKRVTTVSDVEKYMDYYKWFDDALSTIIKQLMPASIDSVDTINNVIESHVLERNKYQSKFPTIESKTPEVSGSVYGRSEASYPYGVGFSPPPQSPRNTTVHEKYWKDRAERTASEISSGIAAVDAQRETFRKIITSTPFLSSSVPQFYKSDKTKYTDPNSYKRRRLIQNYIYDVKRTNVIKGGINFADNKNIGFTLTSLRPAGNIDRTGTKIIPQNVLLSFMNDLAQHFRSSDPRPETFKDKRYLKVLSGKEYEDGLGYSNLKSSMAFPFNIISSSNLVNTGYQKEVNQRLTGAQIQITNLHNDVYGPDLEKPMQGPFTEYAVGGHQSRHIGLSDGTETWWTRPEAWRILLGTCTDIPSGAIGMVGPDYPNQADYLTPNPYPDVRAQKAVYYRDMVAKRPVNIKNIKLTTGSTILGNYSQTYNYVHSVGAYSNPRHFVDNQPSLPSEVIQNNTTSSTVARTILDVHRTTNGHTENVSEYSTGYLTGAANKSIIISRFSAPGGVEVSARGYQDFRASEYSVYNSLNYRNLSVIKPSQGPSGTISTPATSGDTTNIQVYDIHGKDYGFYSHLARHTARFGRDSLFVTGSGSSDGGPGASYVQAPGFHKVHRNNLDKPKIISTVSTPIYEGLSLTNDSCLVFTPESSNATLLHTSSVGSSTTPLTLINNITSSGGEFSWSGWIKFGEVGPSDQETIFALGLRESQNPLFRLVKSYGGTDYKIQLWVRTANNPAGDGAQASTVWSWSFAQSATYDFTGSWNHFVLTWDAVENGELTSSAGSVQSAARLYFNGTLQPSASLTPGDRRYYNQRFSTVSIRNFTSQSRYGNNFMSIGGDCQSTAATRAMTGSIDEYSFWTKTLNQQNVNTLYNSGIPCDIVGEISASNLPNYLWEWLRFEKTDTGEGNSYTEIDPTNPGTYNSSTNAVIGYKGEAFVPLSISGTTNDTTNATHNSLGYPLTGCAPTLARYDEIHTYASRSSNDNFNIVHQIPRSSKQYLWITQSLKSDNSWVGFTPSDYLVKNTKIGQTSGYYVSPYSLLSASEVGSAVSGAAIRRFADFTPSQEQHIPQVSNLNLNIHEPISSSINTIGYPTSVPLTDITETNTQYMNTGLIEMVALPSVAQGPAFNNLMFKRGNQYGYPSWKQLRQHDHPVLRTERDNNQISLAGLSGSNENITKYVMPPVSMMGRPNTVNFQVSGTNALFTIKATSDNEKIYYNTTEMNNRLAPAFNTFTTPDIQMIHVGRSTGYLLNWVVYEQQLFPSLKNEFVSASTNKSGYDNLYWRDERSDRNTVNTIRNRPGTPSLISEYTAENSMGIFVAQSCWPLDAQSSFLTRTNLLSVDGNRTAGTSGPTLRFNDDFAGELQNVYTTYLTGAYFTDLISDLGGDHIDKCLYSLYLGRQAGAGALYARKHTNTSPLSTRTPYGPRAPYAFMSGALSLGDALRALSGSVDYSIAIGAGEAHWDAPAKAGYAGYDQATNSFMFVSAASEPWFNTYDDFRQDLKLAAKGFAVIPEYRISENINLYEDSGDQFNPYQDLGLEIPHTTQNSRTNSKFYTTYSNSEFLHDFLNIKAESLLDATEIMISCTGAIRLNPYKGFYPVQRTLDLVEQFKDSHQDNIMASLCIGTSSALIVGATSGSGITEMPPGTLSGNLLFPEQSGASGLARPFMSKMFSPGLLFNTIKSGMAVDYPIVSKPEILSRLQHKITGTAGQNYSIWALQSNMGAYTEVDGTGGIKFFDKRLPFETLLEPKKYLNGLSFYDMEPHPSASMTSVTCSWVAGESDEGYSTISKNFFGAVPSFFLKDGEFSSIKSEPVTKTFRFQDNEVYMMRVKMERSTKGPRVYTNEVDGFLNNVVGISGSSANSLFSKFGGKTYVSGLGGYQVDRFFPLPQDPLYSSGSGDKDSVFKETFTMYSRASAFGPDISGRPTGSINVGHYPSLGHFAGTFDSINGFNPAFTPPYSNGEAWCDVIFRPSASVDYSLEQIMAECKQVRWRFDAGRPMTGSITGTVSGSGFTYRALIYSDNAITTPSAPYDGRLLNESAMQIDACLNLFGVEDIEFTEIDRQGLVQTSRPGTTVGKRWVIRPKFETPMMNFSDNDSVRPISGSREGQGPSTKAMTLPANFGEATPNGMWHQFGLPPQSKSQGIFISVEDIPENWLQNHYDVIEFNSEYNNNVPRQDVHEQVKSLASLVGFNTKNKVRLGELKEKTKLREAIVAIPYITQRPQPQGLNNSTDTELAKTSKFFISIPEERYKAALQENYGSEMGDSFEAAGPSISKQIQKMQRYIFPPQLDFVNNPEAAVDPFVAYIFEFEYDLDKTDLSYIWQNLAPKDYKKMTIENRSIAHELMDAEILNETVLEENQNLRWMVFKVKQKGQEDYWDYVDTQIKENGYRNRSIGIPQKPSYAFKPNWPYDYVSFVEMAKLNATIKYSQPTDEINKRQIKRETKKVVDNGKARNMYSSTKKSLTFKSIKSVGIGSATSNVTAQVINTGDGGDY